MYTRHGYFIYFQGNTFQIVIASDELSSFAIFNYLDKGIKWTTGAGKLAGLREDPPAQAGFDSGSGRLHHKLPYSGTQNVDLLAEYVHTTFTVQNTRKAHLLVLRNCILTIHIVYIYHL